LNKFIAFLAHRFNDGFLMFWREYIENGCARELGKTRGAIGFALIFLCFVSLYQDKEMKKKDI
jgi:hypothetical protein